MRDKDNEVRLRRPRKVTIVESIVEQIVQQIQDGVLKPGDRLPSERQLIDMLGVSRSSVREALQGLAAMGLVESRPGQGSFVASVRGRSLLAVNGPSLSDRLQRQMHLHLIEARRTIEGPIAILAAERASAEDIARMRQAFEQYRRDPFGRIAGARLPNPHTRFHLLLTEMTGNPFFVPVVENLLETVPSSLREREVANLDADELASISADEIAMHETILAAIERRDSAAASKAMDFHLDYERQLVLRIFAGGEEDGQP